MKVTCNWHNNGENRRKRNENTKNQGQWMTRCHFLTWWKSKETRTSNWIPCVQSNMYSLQLTAKWLGNINYYGNSMISSCTLPKVINLQVFVLIILIKYNADNRFYLRCRRFHFFTINFMFWSIWCQETLAIFRPIHRQYRKSNEMKRTCYMNIYWVEVRGFCLEIVRFYRKMIK